jgi:hypothetical protein
MNSNHYLHNLRSAENENRSLPGTAQLSEPVANYAPGSFSSRTKDAESVLKTEPVAEKPEPARSIDVRDYKKLNSSEPKTACYVCGRKGTWFIEKYTNVRRPRSKDQQDARRVCRSGYNYAVKAEQMALVPLPGMVDVSRCERVTADVGKCSVCGLVKAEWIDREGVMLCEHCYGRGMRKSEREAGVG